MTSRPRLLLLDAGAVFQAFRVSVWGALCKTYDVVVPAIIVRTEA